MPQSALQNTFHVYIFRMQICQDAEFDINCVDYYIWTVNRSFIVFFFFVGDDIINGDLVRIVVINTIGKKERPIVAS